MRIAFSPSIFRIQREGGISRYYSQLIAGLTSLDHKVYLGNDAPDDKYMRLFRQSAVDFSSSPKTLLSSIMTDERNPMAWVPRDLKNWEPDIIHETFFSTKWFRGGPKKAKRVLTVYDLIFEKSQLPNLIRREKAAALKLSDHVICISKNTQNELMEYYDIPLEKTSVIHLAPFPLPEIINDDISKEYLEMGDYFLFVGMRDGYKNFQTLLTAFSFFGAQYKNYKLVAFGGGTFSPQESEFINQNNLKNRVIHISGSDISLACAYKRARALVYPSIWEGFGMPPLEALQFGTEVIASNTPSLLEVLEDFNVTFFNPFSVRELVDKLIISANSVQKLDLEDRKKLLNNKYSWDICVSKTINLYKNLL